MCHRVGKLDVGADGQTQPRIGPSRRRRTPRIDDVELGAVAHAFEHVVKEDRMGFARVRSPQEDDAGLFGLLV